MSNVSAAFASTKTNLSLLAATAAAMVALNAVTAVLIGGFCRNAHLVISAGTITTTPPAIQLECSDGTGVWYPIGSPLTAVANIGAQLTVSNINAPFVRAKVTTAGSGATLNWVLLKLF